MRYNNKFLNRVYLDCSIFPNKYTEVFVNVCPYKSLKSVLIFPPGWNIPFVLFNTFKLLKLFMNYATVPDLNTITENK